MTRRACRTSFCFLRPFIDLVNDNKKFDDEIEFFKKNYNKIYTAFKKDYDRNNQYVKFFKKVNKQGKTEVNDDVKGGAKGGSKGRKTK